ncbi:MAG: tetratricopeptide repeat protein [Burkholderiales bacterium]
MPSPFEIPDPEQQFREAENRVTSGDPEAIELLSHLCHRFPDDARPRFLLGALFERLGRFEESLSAQNAALQRDGGHVQVIAAKARVLDLLGQTAEAERFLSDALRDQPRSSRLWANLGVLLEKRNEFAGALAAYDQALALDNANKPARVNRGHVLSALRRPDEALANNRMLVETYPADAFAHYNLAEVLLALHRYHEVAEACDRALAIDAGYAKAYVDRGLARAALGQVAAARCDFEQACELDAGVMRHFHDGFGGPGSNRLDRVDAGSIFLQVLHEECKRCDWSRRDHFAMHLEALVKTEAKAGREIANPDVPFMLFSHPVREDIRFALSASAARTVERDARADGAAPYVHSRKRRSRLRLGYVSPDFREHAVGFLTRRLYGLHRRERFEVFAYSLQRGTGALLEKEIATGCDVFSDVSALTVTNIAAKMYEDGIDIAIDLAGYGANSRPGVFALRPAPIQVSFLGFPATLGADWMDYAIVDGVSCPPGADVQWREKLVRMPYTYFITDNRQVVDDLGLDRAGAGLPESGFVFCSFNNPYKVDPRMFEIWIRLLHATPGAVLWILAPDETVQKNLLREAGNRGCDPARLIFAPPLPHARHLGRLRFADLFLDTHPCNAHTTAADALWANVPLITIPGTTMPSRVASSLLTAAGMPELICRDFETYEAMALKLANTPGEIERAKQKLVANRSTFPFFDTESFVEALEQAYAEMWRRFEAGLSPAAFNVVSQSRPAIPSRWY